MAQPPDQAPPQALPPAPAQSMYSASLRLPSQLDITSGNISENFKRWRREVQIYLAASGAGERNKNTQTAIILNCAGSHVLEIYDQFTWENEGDKDDPEKVLDELEKYCNPRDNEVLESHRFWNIPYQDPFDKFLTEMKTKASACNFQEKDRMMRDKIVFSVTGKLQELLLREDKLTLDKAVKVCRAFEQSNKQVKEIRDTNPPARVNKVASSLKSNRKVRKPAVTKSYTQQKPQKPSHNSQKGPECHYCGYHHAMKKEKCPAWGETCDFCKGRNHFKAKCKKVHAVSVGNDNISGNDEEAWLMAVDTGKRRIHASLCVNDNLVKFQLDSAADVNTICQKHVRKSQVTPCNLKLNMWNKTNLKPLGECTLNVTNPRTGTDSEVTFIVVPNGLTNLLGLTTIQELKFVTVNEDRFISQVAKTSPKLGDLGEATLHTDDSVQPKVLPCRKVPLAIQSAVKQELNRLEEMGVLVPVTEPTQWVSQMAAVHKANGKLRLYIDPQPLNTALMREHYRLPVLDDILPKLKDAKVFSKLDIKEAYWHVRLDKQSSLLTTMITPFGRYRWTRLPFGLKVSSEIFQRKLDEALDNLDGVFSVVDDIIIAGCGPNVASAQRDNERRLANVLRRCEDRHITLNEDKQVTGLDEINFHGHRITRDGVKVDDGKVKAIREMPSPTDVSGVKRICGMAQYMSRFVPDLAETLDPIRALTRKGTPWNWSTECEEAFKILKQKLTTTPCLAYFDQNKEVVLQVDSSKSGIGVVLLQEGRPVEYASRALTTSERKWAQIEKEALSVLYGLERFDQYTYGRNVKVQNDHKPLAAILKKPLSMAPKRLQDIMMRFYRYDVDFEFVKGVNLVIADTLSRAYVDTTDGNHDERARILTVNAFGDIPDARISEVREATAKDSNMQTLLNLIVDGWPTDKRDLPAGTAPYFDMRESLSVVDGIVMRGETIVIPPSLRSDMKSRLHSAHLGYQSMLRRARATIFWPGMSADIKQLADTCEVCQENKPRNQPEPLTQHCEGNRPWEKIGLDLFQLHGKDYLVSVDYVSHFIECDLLTTTTSARVISFVKKHAARYGIPKMIVSDGGPQFTSREFKCFVNNWGITHVVSSPMHQQANGKAESAVKIIKTLLHKTGTEDPYEALLEQRNTPRQDTGISPAQAMFGRTTRTFIPNLQSSTPKSMITKKRETRRQSVKRTFDRHSRPLSELSARQPVYFQHLEGERWKLGSVKEKTGPKTYIVEGTDGGTYRRNRVLMRPTSVVARPRELSPFRVPEITPQNTSHDINPSQDELPRPVTPRTRYDNRIAKGETLNIPSNVVPGSPTTARDARPKRDPKPPSYLKDYVT